MKVGTLKELNVKPGDVVELIGGSECIYTIDRIAGGDFYGDATDVPIFDDGYLGRGWKLISRSDDTQKLWRDMTPEEKGALLLAHHEGKEIQAFNILKAGDWSRTNPLWIDDEAYRIKPEPKVEVVTMDVANYDQEWEFYEHKGTHATHRITFNTIDGKPDPASIKIEEL